MSSLQEQLNKLRNKEVKSFQDLLDLSPEYLEKLKGEHGEDYILTEEDKQEIASMIEVPIVEKVIEKEYVLDEATKQEIADKIDVPIVEKVIEKTEVIKEQPIVTEVTNNVENSFTLIGEQVIDKINEDGSDKVIRKEKVEGLDEALQKIDKKTNRVVGANRNLHQLLDVNVAGVSTDQSIKWDGTAWIPYTPGTGGGSFAGIPQLSADPVSPAAEDAWVLKSGGGQMQTSLGTLKFLLGNAPVNYKLSYRTQEGSTVRVNLS